MRELEKSQYSENIEFLEALLSESKRLFTLQYNLGDLPKVHESFAECVKAVKHAANSELTDINNDPETRDNLLSAIGDYFYWIDKTARSGYVQRDFIQSTYIAHITEQVDFLFKSLQEFELEEIIEESFIILGVESVGEKYNRDGFTELIRTKFEPQKTLNEHDPNFSRKRTIPNKSEFPAENACATTLEEIRAQLFGQPQPHTPNQFPSVEPSSIDSPSRPSQSPGHVRHAIYAAVTLIGFTGSGAMAYYNTSHPQQESGTDSTIAQPTAATAPPYTKPPHEEEKTHETPSQPSCSYTIDTSPDNNPDFQAYILKIQRNAPPKLGQNFLNSINSINHKVPANVDTTKVQTELMEQFLTDLSTSNDQTTKIFALTHLRNLEKFKQTNNWAPGQEQTALIFNIIRPLKS